MNHENSTSSELISRLSNQNPSNIEGACKCYEKGGVCNATFNTCKCNDGYLGELCDHVKCSNQISQSEQCNYGICIHHVDNVKDVKCKCNATHTGALCNKPICEGYCYNGACSSSINEENAMSRLTCKCSDDQRFSGDRCQFDKCFNEVKANKCPHNCTLDSSCKCLCGEKCDTYHCNHRGVCTEVQNQITCK